MNKKKILLVLIFMFVLSFTGCGKKTEITINEKNINAINSNIRSLTYKNDCSISFNTDGDSIRFYLKNIKDDELENYKHTLTTSANKNGYSNVSFSIE